MEITKKWHKATDKQAITYNQLIEIEKLGYRELSKISYSNAQRTYTKEDANKIITFLKKGHSFEHINLIK